MTMTAPSFSQIRAQVAAIRRHAADARVFGIQTPGRWTGELLRTAGDETYAIVQCDSPLAMRAALQEASPDVTALVLLTNLPDEQISSDIRVRLARRKFYPINNWQIVKELFQARYLDPRVAEHGWIAERLLEAVPAQGYPPVPSGVLDAETVWGILLAGIGLGISRPDLVTLLKWSMDLENVQRYREAPETFREAAKDWIGQFAGPATATVLKCVVANQRPDALPIGLALAVLFSSEGVGKLDKAAGRIEKYLGQAKLDELVAKRWQAAATEIARLHLPDVTIRSGWLRRADEILEAIEADQYAYLSGTSPHGFAQRLARYGQALVAALDNAGADVPEQVDVAYRQVAEHEQAKWERGSRCLQRVEMSARLVRWLFSLRQAGAGPAASFAVAAREQALAGGFVDWARHTLRGGEPVHELSDAYTRLVAKVLEASERHNQRFGKLLRDWTAAGAAGSEVLPVERVLDEVVAPLAEHTPVLVLVIELDEFRRRKGTPRGHYEQDWVEIRPEGHGPTGPASPRYPR